ncbi:hypothetical protein [Mycoplasma hafezii]|uniref:hypothetical protein n=1 Tax=Mycoplasma hafezii TaxID=525886 RepID=UPI003CF47A5B
MLSNKEVHFLYSKNSELQFQNNINETELKDFLKNKRVVDSENEEQIRNNSNVSSVNDVWYKDASKYFEKVILNNPKKLINIWINADNLRFAKPILELLKYPNVHICGIEDSNMLAQVVNDEWMPFVSKTYWDEQNHKWLQPKIYDRGNQYLIPTLYPNVSVYFSNSNDVEKSLKWNLKNIYPFFNDNSGKEIKDAIFATRDINKKRLFSYWGKITNLNWEHERDKVKSDFELNHKPSLILLGAGNPEEDQNYITYIAAKYSDQYNIYYKGHPGHNIISTWVNNNFVENHNSISYFNYESKQNEAFVLPKNNIVRPLESQIPSEELTTEHALEENGLRFDKWTSVDFISSALFGIINGYNTLDDFIEIKFNKLPKSIDHNSNQYKEKLEELLSTRLATKFINISLKDNIEASNKVQLSIDDFNITTTNNSYMEIISATISNVKIVGNKSEYTFKINLKFASKQANDTVYTATITKSF